MGNRNSYNNLFRGKLPSIYKTDGLGGGVRQAILYSRLPEIKHGLVSHNNLRKDSADESNKLGGKGNQSQLINLKRKPAELNQDIDVSGSVGKS